MSGKGKTIKDSYSKKDKDSFLEVLIKKDGHISKACDAFGISRRTYYNWLKDDWFKEAVEDVREFEIDDAEDIARVLRKGIPKYKLDDKGEIVLDDEGEPIVLEWIQKPDSRMIRHYLDTQAKKRGYGKSMEIDLNVLMPDNVSIGLKVHKKK